jgi:hypothetical protein
MIRLKNAFLRKATHLPNNDQLLFSWGGGCLALLKREFLGGGRRKMRTTGWTGYRN